MSMLTLFESRYTLNNQSVKVSVYYVVSILLYILCVEFTNEKSFLHSNWKVFNFKNDDTSDNITVFIVKFKTIISLTLSKFYITFYHLIIFE